MAYKPCAIWKDSKDMSGRAIPLQQWSGSKSGWDKTESGWGGVIMMLIILAAVLAGGNRLWLGSVQGQAD